jgi:hypothetical protein
MIGEAFRLILRIGKLVTIVIIIVVAVAAVVVVASLRIFFGA